MYPLLWTCVNHARAVSCGNAHCRALLRSNLVCLADHRGNHKPSDCPTGDCRCREQSSATSWSCNGSNTIRAIGDADSRCFDRFIIRARIHPMEGSEDVFNGQILLVGASQSQPFAAQRGLSGRRTGQQLRRRGEEPCDSLSCPGESLSCHFRRYGEHRGDSSCIQFLPRRE